MVAFGHTAVGALVGIYGYQTFSQGNLITGLTLTGALGVISHYVMDFIPHGHFFKGTTNFKKYIIWVILFDLLLPIVFLLTLAQYFQKGGIQTLYILFGIGGAQLPDIIDSLIYLKFLPKINLLELENKFHQGTHWHGTKEKTLLFSFYDVWQIAVFLIATILIIK